MPGTLFPEIRVAMRKVEQVPSTTFENGEKVITPNPDVYIYDTSGPFSDPNIEVDLKKGLPRLREEWIVKRGDVEQLPEITSEYAIKHTYCDLAIKLDGSPRILIEVKAAGLDLKLQHIKQAVDYGSNAGVDWVILTNGIQWKVYKIIFAKPIDTELVYEFDLTELSAKKASDLEMIYCLSREAMVKSGKASYLEDYHTQRQLMNRFTIGQVILSEPVVDAVKRVLRKMGIDSKVSNEDISDIILNEVLKREILDDEKSKEAKKKIAKALKPAPKPKEQPAEQ